MSRFTCRHHACKARRRDRQESCDNVPDWLKKVPGITWVKRAPEAPPTFCAEAPSEETTRVCRDPKCAKAGKPQPITAFRLSNTGMSRGYQCQECRRRVHKEYDVRRGKSGKREVAV